MPQLSKEDLNVIQTCFVEKNWRRAEICRQFRGKSWKIRQVNRPIKKFEETACIFRKKGSGRPITACTQENIAEVKDLALSQEDKPGTHKSQRNIAQRLGISNGSVHRIVKRSGLKSVKKYSFWFHLPRFICLSFRISIYPLKNRFK